MKYLLKKDHKNRLSFKDLETKRYLLKSMIKNKSLPNLLRWNSVILSNELPKTSFVNRCVLTNRKKRINNFYSYSRIAFRKMVQTGTFLCFSKSSW